jgi:hypothetical protein
MVMEEKLEKLAATLRDALKHTPTLPLRRHHDDDYWDRVTVQASTGANLVAFIRPRYKTSGLSGDEWRISSMLEIRRHPSDKPVFERRFHRMQDFLHYSPYFIFTECPELLSSPSARIVVERKGNVLMQEERPTFGDAAIGLGWLILTANEGRKGVDWHHLTDAQERQHCQQVGCAEQPVNFYRIKKLQVSRSESLMLEPKYDFDGQYAWYCARHTTRGDCGFEDNDENLVLVAGPGTGAPNPDDESPSALRILRNRPLS